MIFNFTEADMDHCIVYFSHSAPDFKDNEVNAILEVSRLYNTRMGITGLLLYVRGSFMQVLEGKKDAVELLYNKIVADARHVNITCVLNRSITQRLFGAWSMGYHSATNQKIEALEGIINVGLTDSVTYESQKPIVLQLITVFYQSNRYS